MIRRAVSIFVKIALIAAFCTVLSRPNDYLGERIYCEESALDFGSGRLRRTQYVLYLPIWTRIEDTWVTFALSLSDVAIDAPGRAQWEVAVRKLVGNNYGKSDRVAAQALVVIWMINPLQGDKKRVEYFKEELGKEYSSIRRFVDAFLKRDVKEMESCIDEILADPVW